MHSALMTSQPCPLCDSCQSSPVCSDLDSHVRQASLHWGLAGVLFEIRLKLWVCGEERQTSGTHGVHTTSAGIQSTSAYVHVCADTRV